jgi:hypothetical protein
MIPRRRTRTFWRVPHVAATRMAAALVLGACSGTAAVEGGAVCTLGERIPCAGDGGCPGERTCLPDLSGTGPCLCVDPDAAPPEGRTPDPDASTDGGT